MKHDYVEAIRVLSRLEDISSTLELISLDSGIVEYSRSESQISDSVQKEGTVADVAVQENLMDVMGSMQNTEVYGISKNSNQGQRELSDIDSFFKKPVVIATGVMSLSTQYHLPMEVWDLWSLNPAVRGKLRNNAYFRGNLHVRVVFSGTPFHYGCVMGSYQPQSQRNSTYIMYEALLATTPVTKPLFLNYLSQSNHSFTIDPRENKPVELICPFISTKPMHRLFNTASGTISDTTSFDDFSEAGRLVLTTVVPISATNSVTEGVYYHVYAWAEDVELGTMTGTTMLIRAESQYLDEIYDFGNYTCVSESKVDEREVGPFEKIASNAKEISKALFNVPYIKPYAMASHMAFGAMEHFSALFGWSKPTYIAEPHYVKNNAFQNGSQTIGFDTNMKISLDPKQELTVSSDFLGTNEDDMVISNIAKRHSLLTQFSWANTNATFTPIWKCGVTPSLNTVSVQSGGSIFTQPTAMSFAVQLFDSWRGDIEFTFQFVCNQFHRGKIAIWFEPDITNDTIISSHLDFNKQYMQIIDIQQTQSVTFCINWAQFKSWAQTTIVNGVYTTIPYTGGGMTFGLSDQRLYNGYIIVAPVTRLISPDANAIVVNVYTRCSNLMVNQLTAENYPQARNMIIIGDDEKVVSESADLPSQDISCMILNPSTATIDTICLDHFGERPITFRALLKRYVTSLVIDLGTTVSGEMFSVSLIDNIFPDSLLPYAGSDNIVNDLFTYLRYAYIGSRGSIKKRVNFVTACPFLGHSYSRATLLAPGDGYSAPVLSDDNAFDISLISYLDGTVTYDLMSNGGFELELPFYNRNLFVYSMSDDLVGSNPGDANNMDTHWSRQYTAGNYYGVSEVGTPVRIIVDNAAGEDFSFMKYQGAPPFSSV